MKFQNVQGYDAASLSYVKCEAPPLKSGPVWHELHMIGSICDFCFLLIFAFSPHFHTRFNPIRMHALYKLKLTINFDNPL